MVFLCLALMGLCLVLATMNWSVVMMAISGCNIALATVVRVVTKSPVKAARVFLFVQTVTLVAVIGTNLG